ncbi:mechanosensitive ion channel family protein [Aeromicrobium sp. Leaf350]|uniref:mechanosensitive ion channel family protein n=1 Tax=Aeromicrobium sp. Leaf350 TaxID=2876565 RepID=UPI001E447EF6|nr:mechanosensitive ion channel family protein [Aeromicrobium sp. Leaf350]
MPDLDLSLPDGKLYEYLVERPAGVLIIVAVALLVRWIVKRFIGRIVRRASQGTVPGVLANSKAGEMLADLRPGASERRRQRASAMGDLLGSIATMIIIGIAFVMILDQVGVNIAPLLTGAGILGVALGFGAQTLVKDFLAGIFMIMEDQFGVGDVVDMGEAAGTVEAVGLRVTRLRDVNGTVWYVRNGEVLRVGNQSQNWARTVLDVTVSYDADLAQVQRVLADVAHTLYEEPALKGIIIEEPEVWGVERFDKDGAVVRVVLKTAPLEQWTVARTMRQRIKASFDEAGIRIPTSFQTTVEDQQ